MKLKILSSIILVTSYTDYVVGKALNDACTRESVRSSQVITLLSAAHTSYLRQIIPTTSMLLICCRLVPNECKLLSLKYARQHHEFYGFSIYIISCSYKSKRCKKANSNNPLTI